MKVKNSEAAVKAMKLTAPNAPDPTNMPEGAPNAGTRSTGKSTEPGPHKYAFSTTTPVTTAKQDVGAHKRSSDLQVGLNLSKLKPAAPPEGSTLKDGEKQEYESGLIGTP